MAGTATHWQQVWAGDDGSSRSWFQASPGPSVALVRRFVPADATVVDVGGGASRFVDALLERGHPRPTVVDVAADALEHARERLGPRAEEVRWVVADVRELDLGRTVDAWHDRAVLHFLVAAADRTAYVQRCRDHLVVGGHAIIATFAPEGPDRCSGLPVQRYDSAAVGRVFGADFTVVHAAREQHTTPSGTTQEFAWTVLRRDG